MTPPALRPVPGLSTHIDEAKQRGQDLVLHVPSVNLPLARCRLGLATFCCIISDTIDM